MYFTLYFTLVSETWRWQFHTAGAQTPLPPKAPGKYVHFNRWVVWSPILRNADQYLVQIWSILSFVCHPFKIRDLDKCHDLGLMNNENKLRWGTSVARRLFSLSLRFILVYVVRVLLSCMSVKSRVPSAWGGQEGIGFPRTGTRVTEGCNVGVGNWT